MSAGLTVLATDGFAGNRALMQRFCPELGDPFHGGVSTATGDSIGWLEPLGVELRNMGACLRHGQVTLRGTRVNPALPWLGAVLVNRRGERFVDEQAHGYSGLAGVVQAQPDERAVMVWDDEADATAQNSEMMRESADAGALRTASDVDTLAAELGVDAGRLATALEPLPGRRRLAGPFHYAWLTHGVLTTQGGAAIDPTGQGAAHRRHDGARAASRRRCRRRPGRRGLQRVQLGQRAAVRVRDGLDRRQRGGRPVTSCSHRGRRRGRPRSGRVDPRPSWSATDAAADRICATHCRATEPGTPCGSWRARSTMTAFPSGPSTGTTIDPRP